MKTKFIYILVVLLLASALLTGCDSSTMSTVFGTAPEEDKSSYLVTNSDEEVKRVINHIESSYNEVKPAVDGATAETAGAVREEVTVLQANLDRLDRELTKAVTDSKMAQDVKNTYDPTIEDLRTKVNELNTTLEQKGL